MAHTIPIKEDFEIYERKERFDFPVFVIYDNKENGYINTIGRELLLKESTSNRITFARQAGKIYIAMLPDMSEIRGLVLTYSGHICAAGMADRFKVEAGLYEISQTPLFSRGISWFELMPLND